MNPLYEEIYNRLRGKVPMGNLQPLPAPVPGVMEDQPDPAYTPRKNPINAFGARILKEIDSSEQNMKKDK